MCKRGFHQNEIKDYDKMVNRLVPLTQRIFLPLTMFQVNEKLSTLSREATEQNIEAAEEDLRVIREAAPKYDSYMRLTKIELPSLCEDLRILNIRKEKLVDEYNKVSLIGFLGSWVLVATNRN